MFAHLSCLKGKFIFTETGVLDLLCWTIFLVGCQKKVRLYQDCPPLWICIDCKVSFILYSWLIDNWWQWMNVWNGGVGFQIHFMELLKNIDVKLWKPFGYFSWMIVYWIDLNLVHLDQFDKLSWNINTAISQLCTMSFVMPGALITKQRDLVLWHWLFFFFLINLI